ncbi:hypothetical protein TREPR_0907 [Treponema primitia ZAS-2]|uniref:Uncharacterized protein n=1 Tax=Treponema primitia (strain ATCC BAA-887 / DSM 12427 / ZAS-2) TaxID=545694 RepID=F5YI85_TREPZ|nr:hypothetical protein [Treponema primitia]AEF86676.1 hypothetical protein TREPR_0907 [Treponema primitia ZAS-2]
MAINWIGIVMAKASFTFTNKTITITELVIPETIGKKETVPYTLSGNQLILDGDTCANQ